ncbi:putative aminoacyltransferase, E1 ubiquitin-activating enzyme [Rosa chinensis]|uniref:RING-type E3 ubiquitin transferase n=1 Tax=Rosa chinensis TaxID=74649 RepID=A0A2P6S700_ROSCH|nr:E3 ubiquitin-protein ligase RING1-like isoform X2 [Rosa chinensis]PRQ54404.1 putative aminoacyltransferase, E1 ubiquitin-activating enzyme [Rosa chinensis]
MEMGHQQTFWCHECDMSVSLPPPPTTTSVVCPHCFSDLLELMDSSGDNFQAPEAFRRPHDQDNYRLNSPVLQRLIHRLSEDDVVVPPPPANIYLLPASKAYVDAIPTVRMTSRSMSVCAVCKEQFAEDAEAKQLACNHVYHPDCILPWLSSRSSCPLCRYQLPTDDHHHAPPQQDSQHRIQRLVHYRLQLQLQLQLDRSSFNGGLQ